MKMGIFLGCIEFWLSPEKDGLMERYPPICMEFE
jgi:hypothetical protein